MAVASWLRFKASCKMAAPTKPVAPIKAIFMTFSLGSRQYQKVVSDNRFHFSPLKSACLMFCREGVLFPRNAWHPR